MNKPAANADLIMSLARLLNESPELLMRSAEASEALIMGLFLARQLRMVAISCIRLVDRGS